MEDALVYELTVHHVEKGQVVDPPAHNLLIVGYANIHVDGAGKLWLPGENIPIEPPYRIKIGTDPETRAKYADSKEQIQE